MGVASVFSKLPYTHIMDRFSHSRMGFAKGALPTNQPAYNTVLDGVSITELAHLSPSTSTPGRTLPGP